MIWNVIEFAKNDVIELAENPFESSLFIILDSTENVIQKYKHNSLFFNFKILTMTINSKAIRFKYISFNNHKIYHIERYNACLKCLTDSKI